jgi:hypothetical protein
MAKIDHVEEFIAALRRELPPVFLGSKVGELTGGAISWGTTQNRRSRREIPNADEIFVRSGNRTLVARDPFLDWFATTLALPRQPPTTPPPRRERRPRRLASAIGPADEVRRY